MSQWNVNDWTRKSLAGSTKSPKLKPSSATRASSRAHLQQWWNRKRNVWKGSVRHWLSCKHSAKNSVNSTASNQKHELAIFCSRRQQLIAGLTAKLLKVFGRPPVGCDYPDNLAAGHLRQRFFGAQNR